MKTEITAEHAKMLLDIGNNRSTGIVVPLVDVQNILVTNLGGHALLKSLPEDVALSFDDAEEPIMVFARKRLEDIKEGIYKPPPSREI